VVLWHLEGVCRDVDVVPVALIRGFDREGEDRLRRCGVWVEILDQAKFGRSDRNYAPLAKCPDPGSASWFWAAIPT